MKQFTISKSQNGTRAIKYCQKMLPGAGISFLHKMMRKKNITRNGKKLEGNDVLYADDVISFFFSDETFEKFAQGNVFHEDDKAAKQTMTKISFAPHGLEKSQIIYEDDDVLFYNKPSGMLSQKAFPDDISLNEYFLQYLIEENKLNTKELLTMKPSVCNRLDRNTSGLVICGKSHQGLVVMNKMLKERTLKKYYRCIVVGNLKEALYIKGYLKKDEKTNKVTVKDVPFQGADFIETEIMPVTQLKGYTILQIHLITGKTHQIRAQLAHLGFPIIGDYKYGNRTVNERLKKEFGLKTQLLHAYRLCFPDHMQELSVLFGLSFIAPLPAIFTKLSDAL